MVRTCGIGKKIYSVDMMFAYINLFKKSLKIHKISIDYLKKNLEYDGWGDPIKKILYSPHDVLTKSKKVPKKLLKRELKQIKDADLSYPIIIYGDIIIDGVHRLVKTKMIGKSDTIDAYIFDKKLMKKFILNNNGDYEYVDKIELYTLIELFYKRFIKI